jgi:hypothetical protein
MKPGVHVAAGLHAEGALHEEAGRLTFVRARVTRRFHGGVLEAFERPVPRRRATAG